MNKFSIVKHAKIFFSITAVVLIVGIVSMFTRGFNLGIDFTGGSILDIKFAQPVSVAQVRTVLSDHQLGSSVIQLGSSDQQVETSQSVLIRTGIISDSQRVEVMNDLTGRLGKNEVLRLKTGVLQGLLSLLAVKGKHGVIGDERRPASGELPGGQYP